MFICKGYLSLISWRFRIKAISVGHNYMGPICCERDDVDAGCTRYLHVMCNLYGMDMNSNSFICKICKGYVVLIFMGLLY